MANTSVTKKAEFSRLIYENTLWRGLLLLSSLLLNILVARYYQAAASGWIFFVFSYYTLFIEVLGFSMESGISYYASRNEVTASRLLCLSLLLSLAAVVPVVIFFRLYLPEPLRGLSPAFVLFSAISFISGYILNNCCSALFYAHKKFILPNVLSIAINGVLILFLLFAGGGRVWATGSDPFIILLFASFAAQGLVMLVAGIMTLGGGQPFSLPGVAGLKKIGRYSLQAFIANTVFFMLYRIDYWFVEKYCRPEILGNYIQVSKLVQLFLLFPGFIAGAVFPLTAGGWKDEVNKNLRGITAGLLVLYSIICALLALTGYWLFPFLFGSSFDKMYQPFLLLIPGILSLSMLSPFSAYYAGRNRVRVNIIGALLSLVLIVTGDVLFIPRYGIHAAALVSSVGYIAYLVYVIRVYKKEYGIATGALFSISRSELYWIRDMIIGNVFKKKHP